MRITRLLPGQTPSAKTESFEKFKLLLRCYARLAMFALTANVIILRSLCLKMNTVIGALTARTTRRWAKKRGLWGNKFGFFGGVNVAILSAFICQLSVISPYGVGMAHFEYNYLCELERYPG